MTKFPDVSRPLKIVRVIARLNIGGPARHVIYLAERMNRGSFRTVLVKGAESKTEGTMEEIAKTRGVGCLFIPKLGREIRASDDWGAFRELFCLLRSERPDILHTHTAKAGALGRLAGWVYRWTTPGGRSLKIFHTFHGHVLQGYFGPLKTQVFRWIERLLALVSTRVITLSEGLREELVNFGVAPREKIQVVPLGLELSGFLNTKNKNEDDGSLRSSCGIPPEAFVVGIVGRLVPIKNHETLFKAARLLINEGLDLHLLIVGDGELRSSLEYQSSKMLPMDRTHFAGWRFDLARVYRDVDAVVLCSLNEGTPVSLIEAMAASRPVVATGVGGVPDLLGWSGDITPSPGAFIATERGWIVPAQDPLGLAAAIREIQKSPTQNIAKIKVARDYVLDHYDIESLVSTLTALYREA